MSGRFRWALIALVAGMTVLWVGAGTAQACSFADGHQHFDYEMGAQEYIVREGDMKAGEELAIMAEGGSMDLFIFDHDQYFSFAQVGKDSPGWNGASQYDALGVSRVSTIFTAPSDGTYYLVLDNTAAGHDPGVVAKSLSMDLTFPFGGEEQRPFPFYQVIVVAGFTIFALGVLVLYENRS